MGLMTETPWEYMAPSVVMSTGTSASASNTDHHRENIKQLKKMQHLARMKREAEANQPIKAFPTSNKFEHVQSKVQEWVTTQQVGSEKNFLRGHQKTGPFVEDNADSVVKVKRLSGLKSKDSRPTLQHQVMITQWSECFLGKNIFSSKNVLNFD